MFQLTRPRGTRHYQPEEQTQTEQFQLTRPRGTRLKSDYDGTEREVSTHASAGDATVFALPVAHDTLFQLTRPRGTRQGSIVPRRQHEVSTHASAGDATRTSAFESYIAISFNSRVRGGRDRDLSAATEVLTCFNSRVRGGRDKMRRLEVQSIVVSTHASAGDATSKIFIIKSQCYSFNSRVRGGRDVGAV